MKSDRSPSNALSTILVLLLSIGWALLRMVVFRESLVPLTFVLPMLVCVWTRRFWQLWSMAAFFAVVAFVKVWWLLPESVISRADGQIYLAGTWVNILLGAVVVHALIVLRDGLERRNAQIAAQAAELEAQAEELAQQNEEIKAQSEELAQQNEEIEAQSEELAGQNEELQLANQQLANREEVLQGLLEAARTPESGRAALADICRRALRILDSPAQGVAVLKTQGDRIRIKAQATVGDMPPVPDNWPMAGSIAGVVLSCDRTAYVSDLRKEPALAAPFGGQGPVCSVLATPMRVRGELYGLVMATSTQPAQWTQEQFRVMEWVAAQCGLIAEALRWQNELAERARETEAANQAKDHFLAMLSHELRTPLTPVLAAAGVLEHDDRLPQDVREDLRMIRRNIGIQSRLVDDLLDLTKLERGKLEFEPQVLDIAALLHETALIVAPDLDAKDQQIEMDLFAAEGQRVEGDGPRLQQVFWNLLKNANKFSPAKTRIALRTRRAEGAPARLIVDVVDKGMGIDPTHLDRIFRPFEQVATNGKRRSGESGLGLGLSIARAIVDLHGGKIAVASEGLGCGATFSVELPLTDRTMPPLSSSGTRGQRPDGTSGEHGYRILLVEDHGDTGRLLTRLLRKAGHQVEYAETAAAAVEVFQQLPIDLLISDLGLPDESGLDLMRKLRARRPDLVGICLSGYGMEDDLQACRDAGFRDHLTKPVDMQRLHAAISRAGRAINGNGNGAN
ncbi:hybrid sensor histidine kinase/response regulator [Opitutus terrae]|uniref:histidine kinase n=1 Tax=Opitutus terrae (strain DSM 11246 / JCM 15787 / PB90-1) TaxID=452637 RepID=B1ZWA0_OPITP|nr:ATP-binding protein [Opitutus terrae]ACB76852.1 multi-sensor hybrid histidine kinase [Opitutus terrae PB90-1]